MIKPSEFTPATSDLIAEMVTEAFDPEEITVFTADLKSVRHSLPFPLIT